LLFGSNPSLKSEPDLLNQAKKAAIDIPIKAALELSGWNVGNPRSPLSPLTMDMKEQLKLILKSLH